MKIDSTRLPNSIFHLHHWSQIDLFYQYLPISSLNHFYHLPQDNLTFIFRCLSKKMKDYSFLFLKFPIQRWTGLHLFIFALFSSDFSSEVVSISGKLYHLSQKYRLMRNFQVNFDLFLIKSDSNPKRTNSFHLFPFSLPHLFQNIYPNQF